ncbi:MAG: hypothetical protein D6824_03730 [Planctomycetota bacterium]|nr:MAG: hypothetical protein D6824_03730 [Planctomycetota bacterium]
MDNTQIIEFTIASLAFGFKPGPGMLVHAMRAVTDGRKAALTMAVGTETGHALTFLLLWAGLTSLSIYNQHIAPFLALIGGLSLVYIGVKSILKNSRNTYSLDDNNRLSGKSYYLTGVGWAFINPINIAFYASILPTFFKVEELVVNDMLLALTILILSIFFSHVVFIYSASTIKEMFSTSGGKSLANIIGNLVFISIGLYVAIIKVIEISDW